MVESIIPDVDVDFQKQAFQNLDFMLRCADAAFSWAEECKKKKVKRNILNAIMNNAVRTDYSRRNELAVEYYVLAKYSRTVIAKKLKSLSFADQIKTFEEAAMCCASPKIVHISEYAMCDNCKAKVDGSDVLTSNFTDTAVSTPSKRIQNNCDDNGMVGVKALNRWTGIEKIILRIQGQHSQEYKGKWEDIYRKITRGIEDEETIKNLPYEEVVRCLAKTKCTKDAPVIWEAITGNKLPHLSDEVLWTIQHVICKRLKEQDEEDLRTTVGYKPPTSNPQAILYKCLELCECPEFFPFLISSKTGMTPEINNYWKRHCELAGWRT